MKRILVALLLFTAPVHAKNRLKLTGLSLMSIGATLTAVGAVMFVHGAFDSGLICVNLAGAGCPPGPKWAGLDTSGLALLSLGAALQLASVPIYAQGVAQGEVKISLNGATIRF